jgi:effector-binding domain-containing protein
VTNTPIEATHKTVDGQLVAGVRFVGALDEIGEHFRKLVDRVKPQIAGPGFALYHSIGFGGGGHDIEVCFPVTEPVSEGDGVTCRKLPGGEMLCAIHRGPYKSEDKEKCIGTTWNRLFGHMAERDIGATEGPYREIYLEDDIQHGEDTEKYMTEIQIPLLLPVWLDRLAAGLDRYAGEAVRREVMDGSEKLSLATPVPERLAWVKGAMERLDAAVEDETARSRIMYGCSHVFPQLPIDRAREQYERLGSVPDLLRWMRDDPTWQGAQFESDPDDPSVLYVEKIAANQKAYEEATTDVERRVARCHCPFVREAIRKGEKISPTFCGCASGWFVRFWEGVIKKPVYVEVLASVLRGDDSCRFAIHLPTE